MPDGLKGMIEDFYELQEKLKDFQERLMKSEEQHDVVELVKIFLECSIIFSTHAKICEISSKVIMHTLLSHQQLIEIHTWITAKKLDEENKMRHM